MFSTTYRKRVFLIRVARAVQNSPAFGHTQKLKYSAKVHRVLQGILTGTGFLGAGVILRDAGGLIERLAERLFRPKTIQAPRPGCVDEDTAVCGARPLPTD